MVLIILIIIGIYGWVEIQTVFFVNDIIGSFATIMGVFITVFIGMALLKRQGRAIMQELQANIAKGHFKTSSLAKGVAVMAGGFLILLPGYITDAIGLICFVPGFRLIIGGVLLSRLRTGRFASNFSRPAGFSDYNDSAHAHSPRHSSDHLSQEHASQARKTGSNDEEIIEGEFDEKP